MWSLYFTIYYYASYIFMMKNIGIDIIIRTGIIAIAAINLIYRGCRVILLISFAKQSTENSKLVLVSTIDIVYKNCWLAVCECLTHNFEWSQ